MDIREQAKRLLREEAMRKGLKPGRRIIFRQSGKSEDGRAERRGTVEALYLHGFTCQMEGGYRETFRYNEFLGAEAEGRVSFV